MIHQPTVMKKMMNGFASGSSRKVGHQPAMTSPPDAFAAHDRRALPASLIEHLPDRGQEAGLSHVCGVPSERRFLPESVR